MSSGASWMRSYKVFFSYFVQSCPKKTKTTLKKIFLVQCCLQPQRQYYIEFILWNIVPKVLRQHRAGFFLCNVVCGLLDIITSGFYLYSVVPKVLRQHWTGYFPCNVVWNLLREHWTSLLPCNVVWRLLDNIVQGFYLCNVVPRELRQHWTWFFLCWKITIYNIALICLSQLYTRKLLVRFGPHPTKKFAQKNNLQCFLDLLGSISWLEQHHQIQSIF